MLFLATVKGSKKCTVEITFLLRGEAIKWHILSLEAGVAASSSGWSLVVDVEDRVVRKVRDTHALLDTRWNSLLVTSQTKDTF